MYPTKLSKDFDTRKAVSYHNLITVHCSLNAGFANEKGFPHPVHLDVLSCILLEKSAVHRVAENQPPYFLGQFQMGSVGRADVSCRFRHHRGSKECVSWRLTIIRPDKLQHAIKIREITAIRQVKLSAGE